MDKYYCYILGNENNSTYNGCTNNLKRRIRQHNGEIVGGAKATRNKGPWNYICIIEGFIGKIDALKCEWKIKHPTGKRARPFCYCGIKGRIKSLNLVLNHESLHGLEYIIYVNDDLRELIDINNINIKDKISFVNLENYLLNNSG
jgi:predicted GIY-YIG superfamily endonuclease